MGKNSQRSHISRGVMVSSSRCILLLALVAAASAADGPKHTKMRRNSYALGTANTNGCGAQAYVDTLAGCQAAKTALGLGSTSVSTETESGFPKGCYRHIWYGSASVFFNYHGIGSASSSSTPICDTSTAAYDCSCTGYDASLGCDGGGCSSRGTCTSTGPTSAHCQCTSGYYDKKCASTGTAKRRRRYSFASGIATRRRRYTSASSDSDSGSGAGGVLIGLALFLCHAGCLAAAIYMCYRCGCCCCAKPVDGNTGNWHLAPTASAQVHPQPAPAPAAVPTPQIPGLPEGWASAPGPQPGSVYYYNTKNPAQTCWSVDEAVKMVDTNTTQPTGPPPGWVATKDPSS